MKISGGDYLLIGLIKMRILMVIKNWLKGLFNPINRISKETEIRDALQLVENIVIDRILENSITIKWADLDNYSGTNIYACRAKDTFGNNFILLNIRYKKASKEQLACLIAHESCHIKDKADLEEEILATTVDAETWKRLRKDGIDSPLYRRLEGLSKMSVDEIAIHIKENDFYEKVLTV